MITRAKITVLARMKHHTTPPTAAGLGKTAVDAACTSNDGSSNCSQYLGEIRVTFREKHRYLWKCSIVFVSLKVARKCISDPRAPPRK